MSLDVIILVHLAMVLLAALVAVGIWATVVWLYSESLGQMDEEDDDQ